MQDKKHKDSFSIIEIYQDADTYQKHINTSHFRKYKEGTINMVKNLEIIDMKAVDPAMIDKIFLRYAVK